MSESYAGEVHLLIFVCNCIESEGNALDSSLSGNHTTPFLLAATLVSSPCKYYSLTSNPISSTSASHTQPNFC
jgi:hypothetical protein